MPETAISFPAVSGRTDHLFYSVLPLFLCHKKFIPHSSIKIGMLHPDNGPTEVFCRVRMICYNKEWPDIQVA